MCFGLCLDGLGFLAYTVKRRIHHRIESLTNYVQDRFNVLLGRKKKTSIFGWDWLPSLSSKADAETETTKTKMWWFFNKSTPLEEEDILQRRRTLWPFDKEEPLPLKAEQKESFSFLPHHKSEQDSNSQDEKTVHTLWPFDKEEPLPVKTEAEAEEGSFSFFHRKQPLDKELPIVPT